MDSGCWALVNKYLLNIYKGRYLAMQGQQNFQDGLWDAKLATPEPWHTVITTNATESANVLISQDKPKSQLAHYLYAFLFSPCVSTLNQSIKHKLLLTEPGIDLINFDHILISIHRDITGWFPYKSSRGNECIYVLYDYVSNAILETLMANRQAKTITMTWKTLYNRLTKKIWAHI